MPAFTESPVTMTTDLLRKEAVKMGFSPVLRISMEKILSMNAEGTDGKLHCLNKDLECPCEMVREQGICDQGVFKR